MNKANPLLALSLSTLLALTAGCSGGGGGGTTPAPGGGGTTGGGVPIGVTLSGSIAIGSSGGASSASAAASAAATPSATQWLQGVLVTAVVSYVGSSETDTFYAQSDANGGYRLPLSEVEPGSTIDTIHLTFEKDGFVVGEKLLRDIGIQSELVLNTRLGPEVVATQSVANGGFSQIASGGEGLRFGLVRSADGSVATVAGSSLAQAANAGGVPLLDLNIPQSSLNTGQVQAVTAGMAHFDPSDQGQVQSFPGDFTGSGAVGAGSGIDFGQAGGSGASAAADEEYRLLSSSFAQVRLQDQDGNTIELVDGAANAAAGGTLATLYLYVGSGTYATIGYDVDAATAGIQVPIYAYSSGWKYVGNGTLKVSTGLSAPDEYADYTGALPPTTASVASSLYVEIGVTSENRWIQWINLDWPIRADTTTPEAYCFHGTFRYAGGSQEAFVGDLDVQLPDGGYDWESIRDGQLDFVATIFAAANDPGRNSTGANWAMSVWNPRTYQYEAIAVPGALVADDGSGLCNDLGVVELENPLRYTVSGVLSRDGTPVADRWVYLYDLEQSYWDWAFTDAQGRYTAAVPGREVVVEVWGAGETDPSYRKHLRVNGTTDLDESADDGDTAQVDFVIPNLQPVISGVKAPRALVLQVGAGSVSGQFSASAYDLDSDAITLNWSCLPKPTAAGSCSFRDPLIAAGVTYEGNKLFTATGAGEYEWTVNATDSEGATATAVSGLIRVDAANRAPRIYAVSRSDGTTTAQLDCLRNLDGVYRCSDSVRNGSYTYRVSALDRDGDTLSYDWQGTCAGASTASCTTSVSSSSSLVVRVSDGRDGQDNATVAITPQPNLPPQIIYAYPSATRVLFDGIGNGEAITLTATARDDAGDLADSAYAWSVRNEAGELVVSLSGSLVTLEVDALSGKGSFSVELKVTDGDGASVSDGFSLLLANAAPVVESVTADPVSSGTTAPGAGNSVAITLSAVVSDSDSAQLNYLWQLLDGSSNPVTLVSNTGPSITIPAGSLSADTYTAHLAVTDGVNEVNGQVGFSVNDNAPPVVVSYSVDPTEIGSNGSVSLQAVSLSAQATDATLPAETLSYSWEVDGQSYTGQSVQIPAGALPVGEHAVTLWVSDGTSNVPTAAGFIWVRGNLGPTIDTLTAPGGVIAGDGSSNAAAIALSSTATDPEGDPLAYSWSVGGWSGSGAQVSVPAGALSAGSHTLTLTVTDQVSGLSAQRTASLQVNQAPVISSPAAGASVTVSAEGFSLAAQASDPEGGALSYSWVVAGDNYSGNNMTIPSATYTAGSYSALVRVSDPDGASSEHSFTLEVESGNVTIVVQ